MGICKPLVLEKNPKQNQSKKLPTDYFRVLENIGRFFFFFPVADIWRAAEKYNIHLQKYSRNLHLKKTPNLCSTQQMAD